MKKNEMTWQAMLAEAVGLYRGGRGFIWVCRFIIALAYRV